MQLTGCEGTEVRLSQWHQQGQGANAPAPISCLSHLSGTPCLCSPARPRATLPAQTRPLWLGLGVVILTAHTHSLEKPRENRPDVFETEFPLGTLRQSRRGSLFCVLPRPHPESGDQVSWPAMCIWGRLSWGSFCIRTGLGSEVLPPGISTRAEGQKLIRHFLLAVV